MIDAPEPRAASAHAHARAPRLRPPPPDPVVRSRLTAPFMGGGGGSPSSSRSCTVDANQELIRCSEPFPVPPWRRVICYSRTGFPDLVLPYVVRTRYSIVSCRGPRGSLCRSTSKLSSGHVHPNRNIFRTLPPLSLSLSLSLIFLSPPINSRMNVGCPDSTYCTVCTGYCSGTDGTYCTYVP